MDKIKKQIFEPPVLTEYGRLVDIAQSDFFFHGHRKANVYDDKEDAFHSITSGS